MEERNVVEDTYTFEKVIETYGEEIKRLIFLYVKNRTITDDLSQEVFLKIYHHLQDFKRESSIKTWIYQIAINQCRDYFRSWHYKKTVIIENLFEKSSELSVEELIMKEEESRQIAEKVLSLPLKYREIIILFYYKELKINEISELLKVNPSTVKTRLSRGKDILQKKLGGVDFG